MIFEHTFIVLYGLEVDRESLKRICLNDTASRLAH